MTYLPEDPLIDEEFQKSKINPINKNDENTNGNTPIVISAQSDKDFSPNIWRPREADFVWCRFDKSKAQALGVILKTPSDDFSRLSEQGPSVYCESDGPDRYTVACVHSPVHVYPPRHYLTRFDLDKAVKLKCMRAKLGSLTPWDKVKRRAIRDVILWKQGEHNFERTHDFVKCRKCCKLSTDEFWIAMGLERGVRTKTKLNSDNADDDDDDSESDSSSTVSSSSSTSHSGASSRQQEMPSDDQDDEDNSDGSESTSSSASSSSASSSSSDDDDDDISDRPDDSDVEMDEDDIEEDDEEDDESSSVRLNSGSVVRRKRMKRKRRVVVKKRNGKRRRRLSSTTSSSSLSSSSSTSSSRETSAVRVLTAG